MDNGRIRHEGGGHYPKLKQGLQDGWIFSMEMVIFAYKTRIRIDILVDFGDMDGLGKRDEVSLPCRSSYNNTYYYLHLSTNSSIHGKYLLNNGKLLV